MEEGPAEKRPPHRLLAPEAAGWTAAADDRGFEEEELVMVGLSIPHSRENAWARKNIRAHKNPWRAAPLLLALLCAPMAAFGATGEPGQLIETKPAKPVPTLTLTDLAQEQPTDLSAYKGKPLIVNLWATWCGPCVTEMPSLAKLSAYLKDKGVAVVAISEDRGGKFVVDPFLKEHNLTGLDIYLDKTMSTGKALKEATILPMTILIDADGNEVARVKGDRDWDTAESRAEIEKVLGLKS